MRLYRNTLLRYLLAIISVTIAILIRLSLNKVLGDHVPFAFVLCAVVATSWFGGRRPGLLSALLGGIATWYLILPPNLTFFGKTDAGLSQLIAFMIISAVIALLTGSLRIANDAVQERENQLRFMAAAMPEILFTADASGRIDSLSEKFHQYTGKSLSQLSPLGWSDLVHADEKDLTIDAWKSAMAQRTEFRSTCRLLAKDGTYRWFQCRAVPMQDKRRGTVRWFGVCADIDDHKTLEDKLAKQTETLARSNEDLQRFAYAASHDLQEPLKAIGIFSEMLIRKQPESEESSYLIAQIRRGVRRMQDLIQSSLDFSRIGTITAETERSSSLEDSISDALWSLKAVIDESGAQIIRDSLPEVAGDQVMMSRVFQNLISNAIKFRSTTPPVIRITVTRDGETYVVSVADNGIGIPMQFSGIIFEPFRRLHSDNGLPGTGLGLASVRRIIEQNGGRIWVESEPGRGSTFFFTMKPAATAVGGNFPAKTHSA